ncbi:major facilitator superfamily transporter [Streptomyces sp. NBRC 110611]|uniref:MFS transporter n=1 Tax=Streptomyces sp. NBRC 110611 TaxID=1621259 RepID=UPI00082CFA27|nr:MFS transporter [Streptomyces sp. NBRC 110611]GAU70354.1 major facilitator superfamily transporter [Streptomyces sp. NBRC 110611]
MSRATVFALPGYRRLLAGRTLSFLGTALIPTALTLAVVKATGDAGDLGIVLAAEFVPQLLLLPLGGALADRVPAQRVAVAADLVRGAAQLVIGIELLSGAVRITDLAVLSGITGAAVSFGVPTMSPLLTAVVPPERRLPANSHFGVARGLALVAGPGVAGIVVVTAGAAWAFLLTAVLFAVAAGTLAGVRVGRRERPRTAVPFVRDLAEGWQEVRRRPWFWMSLCGHGVTNFAAGVLTALGPLIAVHGLGGEGVWVVIYQAGMAGMVLGAFVAPRLPVRRPLVAGSACAALYALPLVTFAVPVALGRCGGGYMGGRGGLQRRHAGGRRAQRALADDPPTALRSRSAGPRRFVRRAAVPVGAAARPRGRRAGRGAHGGGGAARGRRGPGGGGQPGGRRAARCPRVLGPPSFGYGGAISDMRSPTV